MTNQSELNERFVLLDNDVRIDLMGSQMEKVPIGVHYTLDAARTEAAEYLGPEVWNKIKDEVYPNNPVVYSESNDTFEIVTTKETKMKETKMKETEFYMVGDLTLVYKDGHDAVFTKVVAMKLTTDGMLKILCHDKVHTVPMAKIESFLID